MFDYYFYPPYKFSSTTISNIINLNHFDSLIMAKYRKRNKFMLSKARNKHKFYKNIPKIVEEIVNGKSRN